MGLCDKLNTLLSNHPLGFVLSIFTIHRQKDILIKNVNERHADSNRIAEKKTFE